MKTACCDYQCKADDYGPVFTNTGNNVVQCHNCGEVYVPVSALAALRESARPVPVGERLPGPDDTDARGLVMIWVADIPYAIAEELLGRPLQTWEAR